MLFHRKNIDLLKIHNLSTILTKSYYEQLQSDNGYTALFFSPNKFSTTTYLHNNVIKIFSGAQIAPFFLEHRDALDNANIQYQNAPVQLLTNELNKDNILDIIIDILNAQTNHAGECVYIVSSNEYLNNIHKFYNNLNINSLENLSQSLITNNIISEQQIQKHAHLLNTENVDNTSLKFLMSPAFFIGSVNLVTDNNFIQKIPSLFNTPFETSDIKDLFLSEHALHIPIRTSMSPMHFNLPDDNYQVFEYHLSQILKTNKKLKGYYFECFVPLTDNFPHSFFNTFQNVFQQHKELFKEFITKNLSISSSLKYYIQSLYEHPDLFTLFINDFILADKTIKEGKQTQEIFQLLNQIIPKNEIQNFPQLIEKFPLLASTTDDVFASFSGEKQFSYLLELDFHKIFSTLYPNHSYLEEKSLINLLTVLAKDFFILDNKDTEVLLSPSNKTHDPVKIYFSSKNPDNVDEKYIHTLFQKILFHKEFINVRTDEDKEKFLRELYLSYQLSFIPKNNESTSKKKI